MINWVSYTWWRKGWNRQDHSGNEDGLHVDLADKALVDMADKALVDMAAKHWWAIKGLFKKLANIYE